MAKKIPEPEAAAAAPAPAEDTAAEAKPRKGIPKAAIIAGVLLVQIVAAYFLQKTFLFNHVPGAKEVVAAPKKPVKHGEEAEAKIVLLDEIVVNPAETAGRRYLAVTLGLQIDVPEGDKLIEKNKALIRDALISLLSSKHLDQLANIAYRDTLKHEIKEAVNHQLKDTTVSNVVFSGYVLQ
jgi:flagellar basal body-associated protein FliL